MQLYTTYGFENSCTFIWEGVSSDSPKGALLLKMLKIIALEETG